MDILPIHPATVSGSSAADTTLRPLDQDQRTLVQAVKALNASSALGEDNELTFIMDRALRRAVVRIVSRTTGEVVDQIPSEYVVRMAEELKRS